MPRGHRRTTRAVTTPVLHPQPAGVDIGATELYVCVPLDRDPHSPPFDARQKMTT